MAKKSPQKTLVMLISLCVAVLAAWFFNVNHQTVLVDVLFTTELVPMEAGKLALLSFAGGLFLGIMLCMWYAILRNVELKSVKKQLNSMSKKLEDVHSLTR
jgi:uncharacterized membrane protein YciS (DUF1049 family)